MTVNEIISASYATAESVAYFAGTQAQADAIAQAIDEHLEGHDDLPAYVVVDRIAFELRWHKRSHKKMAVPNAKHGRPAFADQGEEALESISYYGSRRRTMYRDLRRAWDRAFAKAGAEFHVPSQSRAAWQKSNRGEPWIHPDPRPLKD